MNKTKKFFLIFHIVMIYGFILNPAMGFSYTEILDQAQESQTNMSHYDIQCQSFVTSVDYLVAVELWLNIPSWYPQTVTMNLRKSTIDGEIIASVSLYIGSGVNDWVRFEFSPVKVMRGNTYIIEMSGDGLNTGWYWSMFNPYSPGVAFFNGISQPEYDMCFRTYGYVLPVGGTILPFNPIPFITYFIMTVSLFAIIITASKKQIKIL